MPRNFKQVISDAKKSAGSTESDLDKPMELENGVVFDHNR